MKNLVMFIFAFLLTFNSFATEDFRLQNPWVGSVYSSASDTWIQNAQKIVTHPEKFKWKSKTLNQDLLAEGKQDLDLVILQLQNLNSLDLVDVIGKSSNTHFDLGAFIAQADKLVVQSIKNFQTIDPNVKSIPSSSKVVKQQASPFSFAQVSSEADELMSAFVNVAVMSLPENTQSLLHKFQLVESFSSRQNIKEVWTFYDENSWKLLLRAQAGLVVGRALANFQKPFDPLGYLFKVANEAQSVESEEQRMPASLPKLEP